MVPVRLPRAGSLALLACPLLLSVGCATVPVQEDATFVDEIRIEGTKQVDEGAIKERILTSEPWWPWDVEVFDPNAWQADLRRIERFYETRGFYQARIVEEEITAVGERDVRLRVVVDEGEPTRIAEIRIEGLESLSPEQRAIALDDFPLEEGEIFLEEEWAQVKPSLRTRLREMGFAEAVVDGTVEVDVDDRVARVLVTVTPGQRYRFGDIFVATDANPKVPPKWIIEQARVAIEKGQWYSETALAEAQSRVFKMGVFGGVRVNRGTPDRSTGTVPVVIDVREAPFRTLRLGGGIGLDQTRQEVRALVEYSNRNFFGGLRLLNTELRAGYAFLPSFLDTFLGSSTIASYNSPIANVRAEFEQPRVLLPSIRYFASVEGELSPEPAYQVIGGQAKTGLAWQPHPSLVANVSYNFETYYFLRGGGLTTAAASTLAFGCPQFCLLSFVEAQVEWDRRMRMTSGGLRPDPVDPAQGFWLGLALQYGGGIRDSDEGALGREFTYTRILPEARYYFSLLENQRLTVALRARGGLLLSEQETPIVARFYAGGGTSMRGYNNRRLSPLLLVEPEQRPRDEDDRIIAPVGRRPGEIVPIGGERLFEASIEARYRLNPDFILAIFLDGGFNNLADRLGNDITLRNAPDYFARYMQYAVGVGLRYVTLVGPVRVDFGYRLPFGTPPRVYELPGTFLLPPPGGGCFGLGDRQRGATVNPEGRCTLHISIGEAF